MKKKQLLILFSTILILFIVIALSVFANIPTSDEVNKDVSKSISTVKTPLPSAIMISSDNYVIEEKNFISQDIITKKNYVIEDSIIQLKYSNSTIKTSGITNDIYFDKDNNEYTFSSNDELISYSISNEAFVNSIQKYTGDYKELDKGKTSTLSEQDAIKYAKRIAREYFGDKLDLVEFDSITHDNETNIYYLYFYQNLGADNFIKGIYCYVSILPDGTVNHCSMDNYDELINFDSSLLDDITKEVIYTDLENKTRELYGDKLVDFEISDNIQLFNENGLYYFLVGVSSEVDFEGNGVDGVYNDGGQIYRYDLTVK